jgi:hypothetical protein
LELGASVAYEYQLHMGRDGSVGARGRHQ